MIDIVIFLVSIGFAIIFGYRLFIAVPKTIEKTGLGLGQLIDQVKHDLISLDSTAMSRNEARLFKLDKFDLEINFVVQEEKSIKGGIEYKVITASADETVSTEKIQKITLHFQTVPSDSTDFQEATEIVPSVDSVKVNP